MKIRKFRTAGGEVVTLTPKPDVAYGYWECSGCGRSAWDTARTGLAEDHAKTCREFQ